MRQSREFEKPVKLEIAILEEKNTNIEWNEMKVIYNFHFSLINNSKGRVNRGGR